MSCLVGKCKNVPALKYEGVTKSIRTDSITK